MINHHDLISWQVMRWNMSSVNKSNVNKHDHQVELLAAAFVTNFGDYPLELCCLLITDNILLSYLPGLTEEETQMARRPIYNSLHELPLKITQWCLNRQQVYSENSEILVHSIKFRWPFLKKLKDIIRVEMEYVKSETTTHEYTPSDSLCHETPRRIFLINNLICCWDEFHAMIKFPIVHDYPSSLHIRSGLTTLHTTMLGHPSTSSFSDAADHLLHLASKQHWKHLLQFRSKLMEFWNAGVHWIRPIDRIL